MLILSVRESFTESMGGFFQVHLSCQHLLLSMTQEISISDEKQFQDYAKYNLINSSLFRLGKDTTKLFQKHSS